MREVRRIEIATKRLVNDTMAGSYHSVFKGQGMVFQEVREYMPGDDVRRIDWNVTARTGRPHIKTFREERELTVLIMVDMSGSMYFGSGFGNEQNTQADEALKRNYAARIAALLAFSAIQNNDRVGLLLFTDRVEKFIPPRKGRNHVLRVVLELLDHKPQGRHTDVTVAVEHAMKMLPHKSVAFMISDFMDNRRLQRPLSIMNKTHDLIAVRVGDVREWELPDVGVITLQDPESGQVVDIDTTDRKLRSAYNKAVESARGETATIFSRQKIDSVDLANGAPYLTPIVQLFKKRASRY